MNKLHLGFNSHIDLKKRRRFLYINDELPKNFKDGRIFDLSKHSLNPLQRGITPKRARELANALYAIYPQGENTLKVRDGRRALPQALMDARRLDLITGHEEVDMLRDDILFSPLVRNVLTRRTNFSFNPTSATFVRLNRAEIGDFDALILGLIFINHFQGQLIIPDFGFYGRDVHVNLIRENRLIAGVQYLDQLPPHLRQAVLSIPDKEPSRALFKDAEILAQFAGFRPDPLREDNDFNKYIDAAIA